MCLTPPTSMGLAPCSAFPVEVEREIIMYLKEDSNVIKYALVAKRFLEWLTPYLHHTVKLRGEPEALKFLDWLRGDPGSEDRRHQVRELDVRRTVTSPTLADILDQCQAVSSLEMRFAYYPRISHQLNHLFNPLNGLTKLTHMYIILASFSDYTAIHLPDIDFCHRLTHLHLSPRPYGLLWKGSPIGFAQLPKLTQLSLPFSLVTSKKACARDVKAFLEKESTQVVILWLTRLEFATVIERALHSAGIGGKRVVLFYYWARKVYELEEGGFWGRAEKVIAWHEKNPDCPLSAEWVVNPRPWKQHTPAY